MAAQDINDAGKNVSKIVIQAYRDERMTAKKTGSTSFTIPINPETFSQKFEISAKVNQASGGQGASVNFTATPPEELRLEFHLDNTNTVAGNVLQGTTVPKQVELLLDTIYKMDGDTHRPSFLKIAWSKQEIFGVQKPTFDCILKTLDIQYVLFNPEGEPLRAKVSASFTEFIADDVRIGKEGKKSPDLTHVRTIAPSEKLWLMAHNMYGQPIPLLQVAQANNLTTFRQIEFGTEIVLPPYERIDS